MRILIAEMDETTLEIFQSFLWDCGHEVEIATDALECMAIAREFVPDVLVLDQGLLWGGSDGVMAEMSHSPILQGIPVIVIAAQRETNDDLLNPQIAAWLRKPFRLVDLLEMVAFVHQPLEIW